MTPAERFDALVESDEFTYFTAALAIALCLYAVYIRVRPQLPGKLRRRGSVQLSSDEIFGEAGATARFRDLAHIMEHEELYVMREADGFELRAVPHPHSHPSPGEHPRLRVPATPLEAELRGHLAEQLASSDQPYPIARLGEPYLSRLAAMLSLTPATAVLRGAGCTPVLRHHRFIVLQREGVLRTIATGYVGGVVFGQSGAAPQRHDNHRITVISPNLLGCGDCAVKSCHVEYTVREHAHREVGDAPAADELRGWRKLV